MGRLHHRIIVRVAFGAALFVAGSGATAGYATRSIAGWTVAASAEGDGCFVTKSYDRPGGTTLMMGVDRDGSNRLSVLNANWSIKAKDRLKLTFRLSSGGYVGHQAFGMASDGKRGFVTSFEPKFPTYFAASRALAIFRGDVPVERLALDGSGAAVAELRRCVAALRTGAAEPKGPRIPRDPFARDSRD